MCKVMIMPEIKEDKIQQTIPFIHVMGSLLSKSNNDGIGYAAVDKKGNLFGERWLDNDDMFSYEKPIDESRLRLSKKFPKMFSPPASNVAVETTSFGSNTKLENARAITLHTRFATTPKGMLNTHPFVYLDEDTSLIHNGVISNHRKFDTKLSTCDSEAILVGYLEEEVNLNPENIQALANRLVGYYACGVFSRNSKKQRILDIFRANGASLDIVFVYDLDAFVITTNGNDVEEACKILGYTCDTKYVFKDEALFRFNLTTGETSYEVFRSGSRTEYSSYQGYQGNNYEQYNAQRNTKKNDNMSNSMIEYMKHKSSIKNITEAEVMDHIFDRHSGGY